MDLWAGAAGGLGLGLPLLVGACGEESCTVAVAERLDVCGGCLVPLFVETNNHLGVGGFFQVCAVGNEFVAVLDVSVLATGEGVGESDAGVGVIGIDVLNVFGEGAPPCFECGVALAVDFTGLNDVGAVCEDVPVLDVRGVVVHRCAGRAWWLLLMRELRRSMRSS